MSESYSVRLCKEELSFSAAHFITFNGNICERLHGHNYRVEVEIHGDLDENQYVIDFIALRDQLREIVLGWDHHVLLPTQHQQIHVVLADREVTASFENRRWVFPREDCILLPVENTTAEQLAKTLGQRLLDGLADRGIPRPPRLTVAIDENHGQWGIYRWTDDSE